MENGQSDTVVVALALIAMLGTIVTAILAYLAQREARMGKDVAIDTGKAVDGRMEEILQLSRDLAKAEGITAGEAAQREREGNGHRTPSQT